MTGRIAPLSTNCAMSAGCMIATSIDWPAVSVAISLANMSTQGMISMLTWNFAFSSLCRETMRA